MTPEQIDYRVPKRRVRVALRLCNEPAKRFELFVANRDDGGWRRVGLEELLEASAHFFPAYDLETSTYHVLNKAALSWVRIEREEGEDPFADEGALFDRQERVRVALDDGALLEGDLLYSPAPGHGRVADFLNEPGAFFTLWTDAGATFVAKSHVVRVTDLSTPR